MSQGGLVLQFCKTGKKKGHFYVSQFENERDPPTFFRWLENYEYQDFNKRFSLDHQQKLYENECKFDKSVCNIEPNYVSKYHGIEKFVIDDESDSDGDWNP
jgi:hypothetical protein